MAGAREGRALTIIGVLSCAVGLTPACHDRPAPKPDADRIVSLVPAATEILLVLGARSRLVGRASDDPTPGAELVPSVGTVLEPSREAIAALEPDLILVSPEVGRGGLDALASVEVVTVLRLADVVPTVRRLGRLTDRRAAGDALADALDGGLASAAAARTGPGPTVLWMVSGRPPVAAGPGSYLDDLLRLAGGTNVLGDAEVPWPRPSPERVAESRPDLVLWSAPDEPDLGGPWGISPAPRVVRLDPDLFHRPGPGVVEALRRLADALLPEPTPIPPSSALRGAPR